MTIYNDNSLFVAILIFDENKITDIVVNFIAFFSPTSTSHSIQLITIYEIEIMCKNTNFTFNRIR